jgi:adenosylcobinamide-phosphate synthase
VLLLSPAPLLAALLLALALDALAGDPAWLYRRLPHPVVLIGRALEALERRWLDPAAPATMQRRRGLAASLIVIAASAAAGLGLQAFCLALPWGWLALAIPMSTLLAWRGLDEHVASVACGLERSLAEGRLAVAEIVGRDPESLDAPAVARAAIESAAENFSDGVIAPLFWGLLLGLPGMLAYKAINTTDSMIGHLSPRFSQFGRFAARLDDAANWLPARLAALLLLLAAALMPGARPGGGGRGRRPPPPPPATARRTPAGPRPRPPAASAFASPARAATMGSWSTTPGWGRAAPVPGPPTSAARSIWSAARR